MGKELDERQSEIVEAIGMCDALTSALGALYSRTEHAAGWMASEWGGETTEHPYTADARRAMAEIDRSTRDVKRILTCWSAEAGK
jgi:hypothetical protein